MALVTVKKAVLCLCIYTMLACHYGIHLSCIYIIDHAWVKMHDIVLYVYLCPYSECSLWPKFLSRSILMYLIFISMLLRPPTSADAETLAPSWPNLSSQCLSGRNMYVEPAAKPDATDTKPEQGGDLTNW